jgi:hypothetical protein
MSKICLTLSLLFLFSLISLSSLYTILFSPFYFFSPFTSHVGLHIVVAGCSCPHHWSLRSLSIPLHCDKPRVASLLYVYHGFFAVAASKRAVYDHCLLFVCVYRI